MKGMIGYLTSWNTAEAEEKAVQRLWPLLEGGSQSSATKQGGSLGTNM